MNSLLKCIDASTFSFNYWLKMNNKDFFKNYVNSTYGCIKLSNKKGGLWKIRLALYNWRVGKVGVLCCWAWWVFQVATKHQPNCYDGQNYVETSNEYEDDGRSVMIIEDSCQDSYHQNPNLSKEIKYSSQSPTDIAWHDLKTECLKGDWLIPGEQEHEKWHKICPKAIWSFQ